MLVTLDQEGLDLLAKCKGYVRKAQTDDKGVLFVQLSQQPFLEGKPYQRWGGLKKFLLLDPNQEFRFSEHHVAISKNPGRELYANLQPPPKTTKKQNTQRNAGVEAKNCKWLFHVSKLQMLFFFTEMADIATDFIFWANIPEDDKQLVPARNCVLAFALIGAFLQGPKWLNIRACLQLGLNHWRQTEREIVMGLIIALLEDFPQIVLLSHITANTGWDDIARLTVGFSCLSVLTKFMLPVFLHLGLMMQKPKHLVLESFCSFIYRIIYDCARNPQVESLKKTVVCSHWKKGNCNWGDDCLFKHPPRKNNPAPGGGAIEVVTGVKKTIVCRHWKKGNCSFGSECGFLHPAAERGTDTSGSSPPLPQTKKALSEEEYVSLQARRKAVCDLYKNGACTRAQFCWFQHPNAASHRPPATQICSWFDKPVGCKNGEACSRRHYHLATP